MKKVIAFAGSNSSKSINQQLTKYAASQIKEAEVELIDLRDYDAPIYSSDIEEQGIPQSIKDFVARLQTADAYIIATPEHNGSLPAFFKNIVDWSSRVMGKFFGGKPVLLLSTSFGKYGAANSLADLEKKLKYFDGQLAARYSLGGFGDNFDKNRGEITAADEISKLKEATAQLEAALH